MLGASVALFILLASLPSNDISKRFPRGNRILRVISENSLAIYLLHVMVIEAFRSGILGFRISLTTVTPVLEIPLLTALTLAVCIAIIYPLKKIPFLRRLIG